MLNIQEKGIFSIDIDFFKQCRLSLSFNQKEKLEEHKLTKGNREFSVWIFWLPALCDMVATSSIYIALNLTYASSFQMLRGNLFEFVLKKCV